ncbi:phosphoglycerate mutase [Yamadazyma tenuis]|uniref:Phosphoglycerate mutase-like protein n=1 Tax=Candida tenuis (strain ATCC 10573 / BCRC 21748 / CBS 615 / JCM 9827 / NBRC 10315 / NRRL Y-1498 / VKM Y-70) TaxID=590646 RepID=G3B3B7_CANTC|nr:phosphoglycerate mutase-like protein [Yamadazyma tenuis ATCC 10573]EGV64130.1 phosphoglycerate mutase-like protein [Yamadazyma tenuis ATCC 10573]WEJ96234.1 phosphoglycerate mutase [Yamadazyma tenuis]
MSIPDEFDAVACSLEADTKQKYTALLTDFEKSLESYWKFETVDGMFKQSDDSTDEYKFDYLKEDFGRLLSWEETFAKLDELNSNAPANECYKVFFLARHGQGYHNLANSTYGNKEWYRKWSELNGDGKIVWGPDPELTELGVSQARDNAHVWAEQVKKGVKLPTVWFSSPFRRSADTLINTWESFVDISTIKPLIMEDFRETIGVHTCDKRSPRSVIAAKYEHLGFVIEDGFEEEDVYWKPDYRETIEEHGIRTNRAFQHIFNNCEDEVVSITSHSGAIRAQLLVLNHRPFSIGTGGMIPVVVKGTKYEKGE